jgi:hypothetical protein
MKEFAMIPLKRARTRSAFWHGLAGAIFGSAIVLGCVAIALQNDWLCPTMQSIAQVTTGPSPSPDLDWRLFEIESATASLSQWIAALESAIPWADATGDATQLVKRLSARIESNANSVTELRRLLAQLDDRITRSDTALQGQRIRDGFSPDALRRLDAMDSTLREVVAKTSEHDEFIRPGRLVEKTNLRDLMSRLDRVRDDVDTLARRIERLETK